MQKCNLYFFVFFLVNLFPILSYGQYKNTPHRRLVAGEIPVSKPGSYAKEGAVYVLTSDITSNASPVFLGKNVTLDLNGYSIKFTNGNYDHIPNSGFEEGLKGWDISKAPGAKIENTAEVHVFLGKKLLRLKAGDEITSPYIKLPFANRSYFAMCGVTGNFYHDMKKYPDDEMKVSVYVEDENGKEVICSTKYPDTVLVSCPVIKKQPRLGGGFVYAHLNQLAAGKYRVRVKAETDCLVDEIDIRPAMDVGISIIEKTAPFAHYDQVTYDGYPATFPSFFDYTSDADKRNPLPGIPQIDGDGTIIIKNGRIESFSDPVLAWGIQSSASRVKVILENVNIKVSGINTNAADIPQALIYNCRFDVSTPFVIQRHTPFYAVTLRGEFPSEVAHNEFYGGQGCLSFQGKHSSVHDNLFVNRQTVTNHYSISGSGDGSKIFNNRVEPEIGSGIWASGHIDVFGNIIKIKTSPSTCEYGHEEYSTNAIRMADYQRKHDAGFYGNKVFNNKIYVTALEYPAPKGYLPMAFGVFYSISGADNYVFNNDFVINKVNPASKTVTTAFYICGGKGFGGEFYDNRITTNVPAAWIASMYGGAENSKIYNNTIIPLNAAKFKTIRMGWAASKESVAENIQFKSNRVVGGKFEIDATNQPHSYTVSWTCTVKLTDRNGRPVKHKDVSITDKDNVNVVESKTGEDGVLSVELTEYTVNSEKKNIRTPYTLKVGSLSKEIQLTENTEVSLMVNDQ